MELFTRSFNIHAADIETSGTAFNQRKVILRLILHFHFLWTIEMIKMLTFLTIADGMVCMKSPMKMQMTRQTATIPPIIFA